MADPKPDLDAEIAEIAAAHQFDPAGWMRLSWPEADHRDWQLELAEHISTCLQNPATRYDPILIAVSSGHGIGKSAEVGMLSNWAMSCFVDAKVVITANTENQLRTKTSPEAAKWFKSSLTAHWFDVSSMSIKSSDTGNSDSWRLDFIPWSEHNTEAFAGLHNLKRIIVLVFDEASKIADPVWEVAEGAMTDEDTIIIWLCFGNPTRAVGRFRECFRKYRHRWKTFKIDSRNVKGVNLKKIKEWEKDYGVDSDFFKTRVRGEFPSMADSQFISTADVDAARKVHLRKDQYNFAPVVIGVDPAWTGSDEFVIMLRQGLYSKMLAKYERNDNDVLMATRILEFEKEHKADAVHIDAGHGTGIYSMGKSWGRDWKLVWFAQKSGKPGYLNKRVEMWGETRDWLKSGGAIDPEDDVLYEDLIGPELVGRVDGILQLESKEDMKSRGQPSPNRADALALTFAYPVVAKWRPDAAMQDSSHESGDYDPLA